MNNRYNNELARKYMNINLTKQKLLLIQHKRINKSDFEIVKEKLYNICDQVIRNHNKDKKISWEKELIADTSYTHNPEDYDRKTVPIDFRLFFIPKEIRILGDFEFAYGHYFLINNNNKPIQKMNMYL